MDANFGWCRIVDDPALGHPVYACRYPQIWDERNLRADPDQQEQQHIDEEDCVDRTELWPVSSLGAATLDRFAPVVARGDVEILLLGCGRRMGIVPPALRQGLRASGIVVDAMDTGAACRTYNVLLAEERRVAAALIGIG